jgi:peptide/bleomycin uptake transporter
MIKAFFWKREWALPAYGGALVLLGCLYGQIRLALMLNDWNKRFFDLFGNPESHTITEFYQGILEYLVIIILRVFVDVAATSFTRFYSFQWRKSLTAYYLPRWRLTETLIEGASQRIQEDISRASKAVEALAWVVASALLTLFAFTPILWTLSRDVRIPGLEDIPGSLVWIAILTSGAGIVISWLIGTKLPEIDVEAQKIEANFRKVLVHGEKSSTRMREEFERALWKIFAGLRANNLRLILHSSYFDCWKYAYIRGTYIVPFLLMGPGVLAGAITIGDLMQARDAFAQVTDNLSVFIHNWHMVTEIRSIRWRLVEFEQALLAAPRTDVPETFETDELPEDVLEHL